MLEGVDRLIELDAPTGAGGSPLAVAVRNGDFAGLAAAGVLFAAV